VEQGVWNSPRRLLAAENAAPDVTDRLTFRESGFQSRGEERPLASGSVDFPRPTKPPMAAAARKVAQARPDEVQRRVWISESTAASTYRVIAPRPLHRGRAVPGRWWSRDQRIGAGDVGNTQASS